MLFVNCKIWTSPHFSRRYCFSIIYHNHQPLSKISVSLKTAKDAECAKHFYPSPRTSANSAVSIELIPTLHSIFVSPAAWVPLSICSTRPRSVWAGRRFSVPCGCIGIRRSGGAKWMLCWLLPAAVKIYYSLNIALKGRKGVNPGILRRQLLLFL